MNWLLENWLLIVGVGLFVWMHSKMHGGHHGSGGHAGCHSTATQRDADSPAAREKNRHSN